MIEMRGRIIIATTNYIDRIDSALMREGRFDYKIKLDKFNDAEIRELLSLMFKDIASKEEFKYLRKTRLQENKYTPVQIINIVQSLCTLRKVVERLTDKDE